MINLIRVLIKVRFWPVLNKYSYLKYFELRDLWDVLFY